MDSIISTFHLDLKLIIAQLVNFLIVALVLWYFALKPLIKVMQDRTTKIENSLAQAKEIETNLAKANLDRQQMLNQTQKEAEDIINKAKTLAESKKKEMVSLAKQEVEKVVADGKIQINEEKEKMMVDLKNEVADLVVLATEKLLQKKVDTKQDKELINQALLEINKK